MIVSDFLPLAFLFFSITGGVHMWAQKKACANRPLQHVGMPPQVPCNRQRKETPYFKVGNRCGCPSVLSSRRARSNPAWLPMGISSVLPKVCLCHEHRRGPTRIFNYTITSAKNQEVNESKLYSDPPKVFLYAGDFSGQTVK